MDFYNFMRECYLRSNPSVDLDKASEENPVNCSEHLLLISEYEKILEEFCKDNRELKMSCNMWLLRSGPQLKEG